MGNKKRSFEDRMILKLHRKYSRDEEIGLILQRLRAVETENGVLKSEVAEKEYMINKYIEELQHKEAFIAELLKQGNTAQASDENTDELKNKITALEIELKDWKHKFEQLTGGGDTVG